MALAGGNIEKKVSIRVVSDTADAIRGMDNVGKSMDGIARGASKAGTEIQNLGNAAEKAAARKTTAFGRARLAANRFGEALSAAKGNILAVGVAIGGAVKALDNMSDRTLKLSNMQANLPFSIDKAREATQGLVSDFDLMQAAINANRKGVVQTDEDFARLALTATKLSLSVGKDATTGIHDLTQALGSGSSAVLENLGIILKVSQAQEEYARLLGKTKSQLTSTEREQAFMTIGLKKAEEVANKTTLAVDKNNAAWIKTRKELENLAGEVFPAIVAAVGAVIDVLQWHSDKLHMIVTGISDLIGQVEAFDKTWMRITGMSLRDVDKLTEELHGGVTDRRGAPKYLGEDTNRAVAHQKALEHAKGLSAEMDKLAKQAPKIDEFNRSLMGTVDALEKANRAARRKGGKRAGPSGPTEEEQLVAMIERDVEEYKKAAQIRARFAEEERREQEENTRFAIAQREAQLDAELRLIEERRAAGADPVWLIEEEKRARLELIEFQQQSTEDRFELLRLENEREQVLHDAKLARMAEEQAARQKFIAQEAAEHRKRTEFLVKMHDTTAQAVAQSAAAAVWAEGNKKKAFWRGLQGVAAAKATENVIIALTSFTRGAALAASPFTAAQAPPHFAAGAYALANAAAIGSLAGIATGVMRGVYGQGSKRVAGGNGADIFGGGGMDGTFGGADFGGGGGTNGSANENTTGIPTSPRRRGTGSNANLGGGSNSGSIHQQADAQGIQAGGGRRQVNITVHASVLGTTKEEVGIAMHKLLKDTERTAGNM